MLSFFLHFRWWAKECPVLEQVDFSFNILLIFSTILLRKPIRTMTWSRSFFQVGARYRPRLYSNPYWSRVRLTDTLAIGAFLCLHGVWQNRSRVHHILVSTFAIVSFIFTRGGWAIVGSCSCMLNHVWCDLPWLLDHRVWYFLLFSVGVLFIIPLDHVTGHILQRLWRLRLLRSEALLLMLQIFVD